MFPEFNNDTSFDEPSFFGMEEVPPYDEIFISGFDDLELLSFHIRNIGEDCCGFIEPINVHYHIMNDKRYALDYNKEFVFTYIKDVDFDGNLPYGFILKFLQYKSKKMLIVYEDVCFLIEKTLDTYKICIELDKIYNDADFFYNNIITKVKSGSILDDCFINLIKTYKNKIGKSNYKQIDDIDLLTKILKLNIE